MQYYEKMKFVERHTVLYFIFGFTALIEQLAIQGHFTSKKRSTIQEHCVV